MESSTIAQRPLVKLGVVGVTRNHDYRFFFYGLLVTFTCAIAGTWAWSEGYAQIAYQSIGPFFSVVFAALFILGTAYALRCLWKYSLAINEIKRDALTADVFGIFPGQNFDQEELAVIQEAVTRALWREISTIEYLASLAFKVGFFGTVWGLMFVFHDVTKITSADSVMQQLPSIGQHFGLAFATTVVGFVVQVPVMQMYRLTRNAAMDLEDRIMRVIRTQRRGKA